jgi:LuxR family maltose regulon positive regulatory protein
MHQTDIRTLETVALISGGRAHFLMGELDVARQWLRRALATEGASYSLWRISALGSVGLVEAWTGNFRAAEAIADEAMDHAREVSAVRHPATAEAFLTLALAAHARGDRLSAPTHFHEGWVRASSNRRSQLLWVFHAAGHPLQLTGPGSPTLTAPAPPVATQRLASSGDGRTPGWVIAQPQRQPPKPAPAFESADSLDHLRLAEPLTPRELGILAHLPSRISAPELAAREHISTNTMKTHLAHIYRKLGVSTRDEAVAVATELGLLRW